MGVSTAEPSKRVRSVLTGLLRLGLTGNRGPMEQDAPNHAILYLDDFKGGVTDLQAQVGVRNLLELLEDEAVEGLWTIDWKGQSKPAIDVSHQARSVDHNGAVLTPLKWPALPSGVLAGELPDQFLDDVLKRHEPLDLTVFIDDEGKLLAVALKLSELCEEFGA